MKLCFSILIILITVLICGTPFVAYAQWNPLGDGFDGERQGFISGGNIGYAIAASGGDADSTAAGFVLTGKIGYAVSDQLALYLSSSVLDLTPSLGFMYFLNRDSGFYLQGAGGFTSTAGLDNLAVAGGIGYEFRPHVALDLMLGYNKVSSTSYSWFGAYTSSIDVVTLAVAFNILFY